MFIKGAEIVYFEFKEVLFDMARKLKDQIDPKTGKMTVVLKKFIEEWLLRRLTSFVKFRIPAQPAKGKEAARSWPESQKDVIIKEKQATMYAEEEALRQAHEEKERAEAEARDQAEEDGEPEMDPEELEEIRKKQAEEEEIARIAREAAEEAALADAESSDSDNDSENSDEDNDDVEQSF